MNKGAWHVSVIVTHRSEASCKVAVDVVVEILGLQEFRFEKIVRGELGRVHQDRAEDVGAYTSC